MTKLYSTNTSADAVATGCRPGRINPDSLTGMIFAMEGIKNTIVLLNGPMGCKFYHSTTSQFLATRPMLMLPSDKSEGKVPVDYNYLNDWFFRQPRVPCTYLDGYDYVYGTAEKVREALSFISQNIDFDLIAIVNSPGASLIGDNLFEIAGQVLGDKLCLMLESPGYSEEFADGYSAAAVELYKQVGKRLWGIGQDQAGESRTGGAGDLNQPGQTGAAVMGEPNQPGQTGAAVMGEPNQPGQTGPVGAGSLNQPERTSSGKTPPPSSLTSQRSVNLLGLSIFNRYLEGDRNELRRIFDLLGIRVNCCPLAENTIDELKNLPKADLNVVIDPLYAKESAKYLEDTLKIPYYICETLPVGFEATEKMAKDICALLGIPVNEAFTRDSEKARAICYHKINDIYHMCGLPKGTPFAVDGSLSQRKAYTRFLTEYLGMREAALSEAELIFSDANLIAQLKLSEDRNRAFCGIEISLPGMGYTDIIPKTHMGVTGAMFLVEQVLNGLMSKI